MVDNKNQQAAAAADWAGDVGGKRVLAIGIVAVIENFAPRIFFLPTHARVFMSITTELLPVPNTSPSGPFDSSRE